MTKIQFVPLGFQKACTGRFSFNWIYFYRLIVVLRSILNNSIAFLPFKQASLIFFPVFYEDAPMRSVLRSCSFCLQDDLSTNTEPNFSFLCIFDAYPSPNCTHYNFMTIVDCLSQLFYFYSYLKKLPLFCKNQKKIEMIFFEWKFHWKNRKTARI